MTRRRVLVTGAAGLLGRHVANALSRAGRKVIGVDRVPPRENADFEEFRVADLETVDIRGVMEDCACLVHTAAIVDLSAMPEHEVLARNVAIASNVLFAAGGAGVEKIIFASSQSVLGLSRAPEIIKPDYLPVDESHRLRFNEGYGLSKHVGEELCALVAERFGIAVLAYRYPVIWDPEDEEAHVARRRNDPVQARKSLWSYIDVRDAADAVVLGLDAEIWPFTVLNISAGWAFCDGDIQLLAAEAYGPVRGLDGRSHDQALYGIDRARELLGYRPRYRWTAEGIERVGPE